MHRLAVFLLSTSLAGGTPAWVQAPAAQATPPTPVAAAAAASAPAALDKVVVTGGPTPEMRRRASTASKIVIGREELLRYGDGALGDVLRRLPGVTLGGRPGRGGDVRLRGLGGGFTQILIDGDRAPAGFSVDQLPPEQVERIEVMRAPTAETGARAVAGTINIILREPLAQRSHELRLGASLDHGEPQWDAHWTRNGKFWDDSLVGALNVSLNQQRRYNDTNTRTTTLNTVTGARGLTSALGGNLDRRHNLNANGRLRWKLGEFTSLHIAPVLSFARGDNAGGWAQTGVSRFDATQTHSDSRSSTWRLTTTLQHRLPPSTRLEARVFGGRTQSTNESERQDALQGLPARRQDDRTRTTDDNLSLSTKWSEQTSREHNWVTGAEVEWTRRDQLRESLVDGQSRPELAEFGDNLQARTQRIAAYTQDEWSPSPQWSTYLGLRYEQIRTEGDPGQGPTRIATRNTSRVLSPLAHALWKPTWSKSDQIRMSLTRSYRAPALNDLIARPGINATYPTGPNPQNSPDWAGNPALKPELATALEIGWERFLPSGGVLTANASVRDIRGLIRRLLAQETVPWDASPRWVSRPRNLDRARVVALELEAKARVDELWDDPPDWLRPLLLRGNLALFHSQVDGLPGPNNRLEQQPKGTLNLGADYRFIGTSASAGVNLGVVPDTLVQQTPLSTWRQNRRRVADVYLVWAQGPELTWRLTASNLAPLDTLTTTTVSAAPTVTQTENRQRTFTVWGVRAEMRF
ncbi:TonB-dependent receptor plug domain-containing protein [Inhella crocodyli]|nr:TonB-dependent receptor [Inhella crocodyli]